MPLFDLARNRTTVRTEILAGCTTFLTMAYIMFLNPAILAEADMDFGAVFVATCLSAAFGSFVMGLLANYPVALAPGMGLNAFFTFVVVQNQGASWQTALGAVFVAGVAFVVLSVLPVREWLINAIPRALKLGIAAGIGLFLAALVVIFLFWDTHRLLASLAVTAFFFLLALVAALTLRSKVRNRPKLLENTLAELAKDRKQLERRL